MKLDKIYGKISFYFYDPNLDAILKRFVGNCHININNYALHICYLFALYDMPNIL